MVTNQLKTNNIINVEVVSNIEINDVPYYTIIWLNHNTNSCYLNFEEKVVDADRLLVLCPGDVFYASSSQTKAFSVISLNSLPEAILKIFFNPFLSGKKLNNLLVGFKSDLKKQINAHVLEIVSLYNSDNENEQEMDGHVNQILLKALDTKIAQQFHLALSFEKHVAEYYKTEHSVANYAKKLNTKPKQLLVDLKRQGFSKPHDLIKNKLLFEAKKMLAFSKMPVKEICYDLGFDDPAYFARFFKKNAGVSALKFRNQINK